MGLPDGFAGVDAEMPAVRGDVCGALHRRGDYRYDRAMDPNFHACALFVHAGVSCCQTFI